MIRITIERVWLLLFSLIYGLGYFIAPYTYKLLLTVKEGFTYEYRQSGTTASDNFGFYWYEYNQWWRRSDRGYWRPVGYKWSEQRGQAYRTGRRGV